MIVAHATAHVIAFVIFALLYALLFSGGHFRLLAGVSPTPWDPLFYAMSIHTLLGDNTIQPITPLAKFLTGVHAMFSFVLTISLAVHA